jgi:hypothetical protein
MITDEFWGYMKEENDLNISITAIFSKQTSTEQGGVMVTVKNNIRKVLNSILVGTQAIQTEEFLAFP